MVSIPRTELEARVETAANLGFICTVPAVVLTGGVAATTTDVVSVLQFVLAMLLFGLAVGTFKRKWVSATAQVVVFCAGSAPFVYHDVLATLERGRFPLVTLFLVGLCFLLVRGARAAYLLHAVRRKPAPRSGKYVWRPTTESVIIR